jgi:hypothetical protein
VCGRVSVKITTNTVFTFEFLALFPMPHFPWSILSLLCNIILEIVPRTNRQSKESKGIQQEMKKYNLPYL